MQYAIRSFKGGMMKSFKVTLAGICIGLYPLAAAKAAPIIVTYTGTILSGVDANNYFGLANQQSLTGLGYSLTFIIESSELTFYDGSGTSQPYHEYFGSGLPSSASSATITVNNISHSVPGTGGTVFDIRQSSSGGNYALGDHVNGDAGDGYGGTAVENFSSPYAIFSSLNEFSPMSYIVQDGDVSNGVFGSNGASFTLSISAINANISSTVPDAAPWAMFIGGFGLIGATMRRKSDSVIFA